jgi:hypothetical protein
MDGITKSFALILIGIMAISCMSILTAEYVSAQTTRPSVPEFTARLTASSLEVTIKNQPLTGFDGINVSNPHLYYGFRFKDPNSVPNNWEYVPMYFVGTSSYGTYYEASGSDYTIVSFSLDDYPFDGINHHTGISKNGPIDMQVIALVGIEIPTTEQNGTVYRFEGEISDWSNIQTITLPASSSSSTPTSPIGTINTGPHTPETEPFPTSVLVVALILLAVTIASFLLLGKHRKTANLKQ